MENAEILELSEKDIKKRVNKIKNRGSLENMEADYEEKRAALSLLGFGNSKLTNDLFPDQKIKFPEMKDENYVSTTSVEFIEEMLEGNHIDLVLLEDIVKIQNGISDSNIKLSSTMNKILNDDKVLERFSTLQRDQNLKKLKVNIDEGRINPEQEWIEKLKETSDYNNIKPSDKDMEKYLKQIPVEEQSDALIIEKSELETKPQIPQVNRDIDEYWTERYRQELEKMGLVEMRFHQDGNKQTRRKYDNPLLDKGSAAYSWIKTKVDYPFETTGIVKLDEEYNVPVYELFKEARWGNGIKFKKIPEDGEEHVYDLAALKVKASGIMKPYVYASAPTNNQDLLNKNKYIERQIMALLDKADYDIDDISVPNQFKPVLEKIKKNEDRKNAHVLDMNEVMQKVIQGNTSDFERRAFVEHIYIYEINNGESVLINFNNQNKEDNELIKSIMYGKKLIENSANPLSNKGQISLLKEKLDFAQKYTPNSSPATLNENFNGNVNKEDNTSEISNENSSTKTDDLDLSKNTLTAPEADLLSKKIKELEKFQDYEGREINPETNVNETLEAIISLKNKMNNPEIVGKLSRKQSELIERKATIAETFRQVPELDDSEKAIIKKVLDQGSVAYNLKNLEPQEEGILLQIQDKYNLTELENTINKYTSGELPTQTTQVNDIKTVKAVDDTEDLSATENFDPKSFLPDGSNNPSQDDLNNQEKGNNQDMIDQIAYFEGLSKGDNSQNMEQPNSLPEGLQDADNVLSNKKRRKKGLQIKQSRQ
jgi:hypothetical protein